MRMKEHLFIEHGREEDDKEINIPDYMLVLNKRKERATISINSVYFESAPIEHYEQIVLLSNTLSELKRRNRMFFSIFSQN